MAAPLLYTPLQAARALGIGRSKLYQLLQSGELESVHIGASRRVPADAIDDLVSRLRWVPDNKETDGKADSRVLPSISNS